MIGGIHLAVKVKAAIPLLALAGLVTVADVVTLGGVVVAAIGVVVAAIVAYFTIRNLQRSYWRNLVDERDAEILELNRLAEEKLQERAAFAEEQREVRHALKTQVATLEGRLQVEQAKHDLSSVTTRLSALEDAFSSRTPMFEQMAAGINQQAQLLEQILVALRDRPPTT